MTIEKQYVIIDETGRIFTRPHVSKDTLTQMFMKGQVPDLDLAQGIVYIAEILTQNVKILQLGWGPKELTYVCDMCGGENIHQPDCPNRTREVI